MASDIAALQVRLDLQSAAFEKGMKSATKSLGRIERQSKKSGLAMRGLQKGMAKAAGAAAAMGTAMLASFSVQSVRAAIDFADAIGKTSFALGLGVEELQAYQFAAERSGIATTQFNSNMTAFVKRVGEAKSGMGPLVSGLKNLDQTLLDNIVAAGSQGEALELVAEAMRNESDATKRAAIANAAFSRSGVAMVGMLADGKAGLDDLTNAARDSGAVMNEALVKTATAIKDKWDTLTDVIGTKFKTALITAADAVMQFFNSFNDLGALQTEIAETTIKLAKAETDLAEANFLTVSGAELWVKTHKEKLDSLKKQETQLLRIQKLGELRETGAAPAGPIVIDVNRMSAANTALHSYEKAVLAAELANSQLVDRMEIVDRLFREGAISSQTYTDELKKFAEVAEKEVPTGISAMSVAIGNLASGAISDMVDGFIEGSNSFTDLVENFLKGIAKMIIQQMIFNAIAGTSFGQSMGFSAPQTVATQSAGGLTQFGGLGSVAPLSAGVSTAGDSRIRGAGAATTVNINNYSGASVQTNETKDSNGDTTIDVMISEAVKREIKRGGFDSVNRGAYGLRRIGY